MVGQAFPCVPVYAVEVRERACGPKQGKSKRIFSMFQPLARIRLQTPSMSVNRDCAGLPPKNWWTLCRDHSGHSYFRPPEVSPGRCQFEFAGQEDIAQTGVQAAATAPIRVKNGVQVVCPSASVLQHGCRKPDRAGGDQKVDRAVNAHAGNDLERTKIYFRDL